MQLDIYSGKKTFQLASINTAVCLNYMQKLFCLIATFGLTQIAQSQSTIALKRDSIEIHPTVGANEKLETNPVKLRIELSGDAPKDTAGAAIDIEMSVKLERSSLVKPKLIGEIGNKIKLLATDWPGAGNEATIEKQITIQTTSVKAFEKDEIFYLVLDGGSLPAGIKNKAGDEHSTLVRVTNIGVFNQNKSFWMEVGANFDLVDGLEANNFFTGVFFYKRDIRPLFYRTDKKVKQKKDSGNLKFQNYQRNKNLAVFAGVFESKTISSLTEDNFSLRKYYDSTSLIPNSRDSMHIFTGIGNYINRRTVRSVGLFFSPQIRVTSGSANEEGLHLFASLWTELQWQRIREERAFSQIRRLDSTKTAINDVIANPAFNTPNEVKESDVRSHYLGVGLPIFYKEKVENDVVQLFVNPVFGFSNQPSVQYLNEKSKYEFDKFKNPNLSEPRRKWSPFYIVQFRLNEESYGIAFTGEVRGLLRRDNQPFVSLSLTKKFDLTKFIEFNK